MQECHEVGAQDNEYSGFDYSKLQHEYSDDAPRKASEDLHRLIEGFSDIKLVVTLLTMLEIKDESTYRHSLNVARLASSMGEALRLSRGDCQTLRIAGILHDIGKIFVDKSILGKEEALSRLDYAEISRHPSLGANVLSTYGEFKEIADTIRWHHERYDGRGYPGRYQGDKIPYLSRILSVCDVWVALVSVRPYRPAFSPDNAREVILKERGKQLDPELANFFIKQFVSFGYEE